MFALAIAACAGGSSTSSGASPSGGTPSRDELAKVIKDYADLANKGQWGRIWDDLIPAEQAIVTKDQFLVCHSSESSSGDISVVEVIDAFPEPTTPPGATAKVDSYAVTVAFKLGDQEVTKTSHVYLVDGKLLLALDQLNFGRCH